MDFYLRVCAQKPSEIVELQNDFYGEGIAAKCYQQVSLFLKTPTHLSLSFSTNIHTYTHQLCINKLNSIADNLGRNANSKPQRGTLVILGLGAGYHINKLMSEIRYTDVIVIEPDEKHYAMACQHINFASLKAECQRRGGSLTLLNVETYQQFLSQMKQLVKKQGVHLLADISVYRHYSTPVMDRVFSEFKQWRNSFASMWGYLEDELLGLKHTCENYQHTRVGAHENIFSEFSSFPVLIVGNGPSLDKDIQHIKTQQDRALIVSCGTSLSTLMKTGVTPDFHIEMERTSVNFEIKEDELCDPRIKDVVLIALSTIYPKLMLQFDQRIIFAKGNDLGAELASLSGQGSKPLYHCNPTVTNMAVAAFLRMGFTNIVLLGCDYGYIDQHKHHSQLSSYYDPNNALSNVSFDNEMAVKGNFRPHVFTSRLFNEARSAQERLLAQYPFTEVKNASDGAFIEGTLPLKFTELSFNNSDKSALLSTVREYAGKHTGSKLDSGAHFSYAIQLLNSLKQEVDKADSVTDVISILNAFIESLRDEKDALIYELLLSGSIKYIVGTIASHINHLPLSSWTDYDVQMRKELQSMLDALMNKLSYE
ncbi:motility associated factor glycosyltransferase family protein [Pseudoalteromonas luteoviolacea]|uniref:DUF115 domain-containing protein n=1 Tax=Pseudoalteromonas luteoviolacea H33 TaxID=1365251 RepID=A0A167BD39_9GAMM|nr:6-hydroxymethylpterin diphosphokinase MptE-like protein [Pseudoalteromonas luteoviolacea]KZN46396.1 hypothetical protein N476_24490 [Pseudoalteromonas luteoviolacea H33]KZN75515.1 hypothetical protein N477_18625 [Pseudoalteromonas luteoviolacea H33-S]